MLCISCSVATKVESFFHFEVYFSVTVGWRKSAVIFEIRISKFETNSNCRNGNDQNGTSIALGRVVLRWRVMHCAAPHVENEEEVVRTQGARTTGTTPQIEVAAATEGPLNCNSRYANEVNARMCS